MFEATSKRRYAKRATAVFTTTVASVLLGLGPCDAASLDHAVIGSTSGAAAEFSSTLDRSAKHMTPGFEQAMAVNAILLSMSGTRSELAPALDQIRSCGAPQAGMATLSMVAESRRNQLDTVRALQVDALPGGAILRSALDDALTMSLNADEAFVEWARHRSTGGCSASLTEDSAYQSGLSFSERATQAKQRFVDLWNPVAQLYGLSQRTADDI
ncbi:hypothetical protein [Acrocarpospora pleiomorpha]|nr:hypothetical protein [Acrocarpospora pleiomorpha]